jgi:hypothetical protein
MDEPTIHAKCSGEPTLISSSSVLKMKTNGSTAVRNS